MKALIKTVLGAVVLLTAATAPLAPAGAEGLSAMKLSAASLSPEHAPGAPMPHRLIMVDRARADGVEINGAKVDHAEVEPARAESSTTLAGGWRMPRDSGLGGARGGDPGFDADLADGLGAGGLDWTLRMADFMPRPGDDGKERLRRMKMYRTLALAAAAASAAIVGGLLAGPGYGTAAGAAVLITYLILP